MIQSCCGEREVRSFSKSERERRGAGSQQGEDEPVTLLGFMVWWHGQAVLTIILKVPLEDRIHINHSAFTL